MKYHALLCFTAWALAHGPTVLAEDAATMAPSPVKPGRPHTSSFDPHGALTSEKLLAVAAQHMAEGRPQEAVYTLTTAIGRYPDDAQLYAVRGSILLQQGRVTPALQDLERAAAIEPNNVAVLTNRAQAYRQFERYAEAIADLDRAIAIDPDMIAARFNRGAMRYVQGDLAGARADFDHCIAVDPHLPAPYFNRAAVLDALGERPAAVEDIERFLQVSDNEAWRQQAQQLLEVDYEDPHSSAPDPNHMFPLMFQSLVTSLSNGSNSPTREYTPEQAAEQFNAHWAAAAVSDINPDFNSPYRQAFILAMHKNQLADAYTVLLFDDLEQAKASIKANLSSLRFLP